MAIELGGELHVTDGCSYPQIKCRVRHRYLQGLLQRLGHGREFFPVEAPVFDDMMLVVPGCLASRLNRRVHGAAMVGTVEEEFLKYRRIARGKPRTHAWNIGSF